VLEPNPVVLSAHGRHAQCVAFTRSGRLLLSAGQDAHIRLWSVPGFKAVGSITGHRNSVNSIAFSPAETQIVTSSSDGTVRVWAFPEGRPVRVLEKQSGARFSPSGRYLATYSSRGRVAIWSMPDGEEVARSEVIDRRLFSMEFSPDESRLLAGGTGEVHFLTLPEARLEASVPAHDAAVGALERSPDGRTLVSAGPPGIVRLWSTSNWAPLAAIPLESAGTFACAFSPDSSSIAVGIDFHLAMVSLADRVVTGRVRVGVKGIYGLAWSPDGRYLANAAADGKIRVWTVLRSPRLQPHA
jgi:WD40 repeat protein